MISLNEKAMKINAYGVNRDDPKYEMFLIPLGPNTCHIVVEPKYDGTSRGIKVVDLLEIIGKIIGDYNTTMQEMLEESAILGARMVSDGKSLRSYLETVSQVVAGKFMVTRPNDSLIVEGEHIPFSSLTNRFNIMHLSAIGLALLNEVNKDDARRIRGYIRGDKYVGGMFTLIDREFIELSNVIADGYVRLYELQEEFI